MADKEPAAWNPGGALGTGSQYSFPLGQILLELPIPSHPPLPPALPERSDSSF